MAIWQRIPSTFLPVEDQGYFFVVVQLPDGASLERTDAVAKKVRDILQATPGVDIVGSISGLNFLTGAAQSNSAVEFAILKPWDERGAGAERLGHRRRACAASSCRSRRPSRSASIRRPSPASAPPAASSSRWRTSRAAAAPR